MRRYCDLQGKSATEMTFKIKVVFCVLAVLGSLQTSGKVFSPVCACVMWTDNLPNSDRVIESAHDALGSLMILCEHKAADCWSIILKSCSVRLLISSVRSSVRAGHFGFL